MVEILKSLQLFPVNRYAAGSAALNATSAVSESDLNEDVFVLLPGTNELLNVFNLHRLLLEPLSS